MAQPVLTYSLDWGNNTAQKLSGKTYVNPSGDTIDCSSVGVTFSSSLDFKKFYATSVKEGKDYGFINDVLVDINVTNPTGILISEYTNRKAGVDLTFTITVSDHIKEGEGNYRIGLYVQTNDGTWNYEYFFLTCDSENVELKDENILQVPTKTGDLSRSMAYSAIQSGSILNLG